MAGLRPRIKEIARIGACPLPEPPAAAVEIVRSALQSHVYDRAAVVAKFRGEAVVLDLEFLNDLHRGLVIDVAGCAFTLLWRTDQRAVNAHLSGRVALSVRNEVGPGRIIVRGARPRSLGYTARKKGQAEEITSGKWNVLDVLVGDFSPQSRALGIK